MKSLITSLITSLIIALISITIGFSQNYSEKQNYVVKALGAKLGSMHISSKTQGENVYYQTQTLFNVNLVFKKVKMEVVNKVHYKAGQLLAATNKVTVNGELHSQSKIEWNGNKYMIHIDGKEKPSLQSPINFSGSMLYFNEPTGMSKAFSESSGQYMKVKLLKTGKYQVTDPINDRNMIYFYENGAQTKVQIKHPLVTISLIRQDPFISEAR